MLDIIPLSWFIPTVLLLSVPNPITHLYSLLSLFMFRWLGPGNGWGWRSNGWRTRDGRRHLWQFSFWTCNSIITFNSHDNQSISQKVVSTFLFLLIWETDNWLLTFCLCRETRAGNNLYQELSFQDSDALADIDEGADLTGRILKHIWDLELKFNFVCF